MKQMYALNNSELPFSDGKTLSSYNEKFFAKTGWTRHLGCRECRAKGQLCQYVSWDGTAQLIRGHKIFHIITPKDTHQFNDVIVAMDKAVSKLKRQGKYVYIKQPAIRYYLESWIIQENILRTDLDKDVSKRHAVFSILLYKLSNAGYSALVDFLQVFETKRSDMSRLLVTKVGALLRNFTTYNILCAIVPYAVADSLISYSPDTCTAT